MPNTPAQGAKPAPQPKPETPEPVQQAPVYRDYASI